MLACYTVKASWIRNSPAPPMDQVWWSLQYIADLSFGFHNPKFGFQMPDRNRTAMLQLRWIYPEMELESFDGSGKPAWLPVWKSVSVSYWPTNWLTDWLTDELTGEDAGDAHAILKPSDGYLRSWTAWWLRVLWKAGLASGVKMRMTGGKDYSGAWIYILDIQLLFRCWYCTLCGGQVKQPHPKQINAKIDCFVFGI